MEPECPPNGQHSLVLSVAHRLAYRIVKLECGDLLVHIRANRFRHLVSCFAVCHVRLPERPRSPAAWERHGTMATDVRMVGNRKKEGRARGLVDRLVRRRGWA